MHFGTLVEEVRNYNIMYMNITIDYNTAPDSNLHISSLSTRGEVTSLMLGRVTSLSTCICVMICSYIRVRQKCWAVDCNSGISSQVMLRFLSSVTVKSILNHSPLRKVILWPETISVV